MIGYFNLKKSCLKLSVPTPLHPSTPSHIEPNGHTPHCGTCMLSPLPEPPGSSLQPPPLLEGWHFQSRLVLTSCRLTHMYYLANFSLAWGAWGEK